ncbi:MAG TPA: hypothetical protein VH640_04160 [Bryobacteraceae bacterium]|jgi:hypothetical protein
MIFLVDYDRPTGRTLLFKKFADTERQRAHDERLRLELDLFRQGLLLTRREVVLLDANDEAALRRTHDRYFTHLPENHNVPAETEAEAAPR